jgi:hypothetical protein
MTSLDEAAAPVVTVPHATRNEDLITALCGTAMVLGVLSDAWAHNNILQTLDGFFTPWHALLYAGFAATGAWTFYLAYRRRQLAPEWWRDGWPVGYRLGAVGTVLFLLAAGGDMAWHQLLGVEANLAAGMSPSHLGLATGATLLLSSPLRSWWAQGAEGGRRAVTGIAGLVLATVIVSIFVGFALAFFPAQALQPYHQHALTLGEAQTAALGAASYLVTTALILVPLLLVHRRRPTPGVVTALVGAVSAFSLISRELPTAQTVGAIGALVGAVLADVVLLRLDKVRGMAARLRLPIAAAVVPALVWSGHMVGLQIGGGVRWPVELWAGIIVLTTALSATIGGLAAPPADHRTLRT